MLDLNYKKTLNVKLLCCSGKKQFKVMNILFSIPSIRGLGVDSVESGLILE